uniref:Uncharacterized protein n=1 Tax=Alexandrium monilatum TaxID=311494 RepID=A0A7S4Q8E4_9DINO
MACGAAGPPIGPRLPGADGPEAEPEPPLPRAAAAAPIGPSLPDGCLQRRAKRPPGSAPAPAPARRRRRGREEGTSSQGARTSGLDVSGTWFITIQSPASELVYDLCQHEDLHVTGHGSSPSSTAVSTGSKVRGRLQGYVLTWAEEETGSKFRGTLSPDGLTFAGTCTLSETPNVKFEAVRSGSRGRPSAENDPESVLCLRDRAAGETLRLPRAALLASLPGLRSAAGVEAAEVDVQDVLKVCPFEAAAHSALMPLCRALALWKPEEAFTTSNAIHALALADWLGCSLRAAQALELAVQAHAHEVPAMLEASGDSSASTTHVLKRGLLITSASTLDALARHPSRSRWCSLCGRAALQCLFRLASEDPNGLRLSPAAAAALALGLPLREVHAAVLSHLRFGPGAASLILDLRKRALGPEGAARLELPPAGPGVGILELDLDLSRCGIRAVGAASLRLPDGLQRLRLSLQKCDIGPEGAKALTLPDSLLRLELDLAHCLVGPGGAAALRLPPALEELGLGLLRCAIGDRGARALALPESLHQLQLDLTRCALGAEGLRGLRLPPRLASLSLDLTMCPVGVEGAKALLANLPATLKTLELELGGCGLSAQPLGSLEELAARRLPALSSRIIRCTS